MARLATHAQRTVARMVSAVNDDEDGAPVPDDEVDVSPKEPSTFQARMLQYVLDETMRRFPSFPMFKLTFNGADYVGGYDLHTKDTM